MYILLVLFRYEMLVTQCNNMTGMDHFEKTSNGITIHFVNKDELNIIIKHDKIESATVSY